MQILPLCDFNYSHVVYLHTHSWCYLIASEIVENEFLITIRNNKRIMNHGYIYEFRSLMAVPGVVFLAQYDTLPHHILFSKRRNNCGYFHFNAVLKAPSHLTECRRTKGYEWEKCTKCTRIQRIQTEFPSNHAISNYCQLLSTNGKQRKNITCEGYRLFGSPL